MKFIKKFTVLLVVFAVLLSLSTTSTFAATKAPKFKDIPNNHWAKKEIDELVSKKIISGYSDGTFKPNKNMTRAEAAVMIGKALNISTKNRPNPNFSDVTTKNPAYPYIAALVQEGVFSKAKKFDPNGTLTRSQMSKILVEAFDITGSTSKTFKDVPKNNWAYPYVNAMVANGITTGKTSTLFDTNGKVTRVQMTVFVKRAMDYKVIAKAMPFINQTLKLVNAERAKAKIPPVKLNMEATKVAVLKAEDMRDRDYYDHTSPKYGDIWDMLDLFGVKNVTAGENILVGGDGTAEDMMEAWMNSKGHRSNILTKSWTSIGIGYAEGGRYDYYGVQVFIMD